MKGGFRVIASIVIVGSIVCTGVLWAEAPTDRYTRSIDMADTITIGWVGDMVPSDDSQYNEYVFAGVAQELMKPDLMIGNLEGTFAHVDRPDKCRYLLSMCHAFRGDPSFAYALKDAGFDFVSLVNNHSYDFGADGLIDTQAVLDEVDIPYISPNKQSTSITVKGKKIGILGLSSTEPTRTITDYDFIEREVSRLAATHDIVIVIFHGGAEGSTKSEVPGTTEFVGTENRGNVELVAKIAVDAGADLVLGAGPHVLRKIEYYKQVPIAYSLGNFVGGMRLMTQGNLGHSGIFVATIEPGRSSRHNFISVALTADGIPYLDPYDESKELIDSLSQ